MQKLVLNQFDEDSTKLSFYHKTQDEKERRFHQSRVRKQILKADSFSLLARTLTSIS